MLYSENSWLLSVLLSMHSQSSPPKFSPFEVLKDYMQKDDYKRVSITAQGKLFQYVKYSYIWKKFILILI